MPDFASEMKTAPTVSSDRSASQGLALLARLERVSRPGPLMLGAGIAFGLLALLLLYAVTPHEWPIEPSRSAQLRDSLAVIQHGGPLLLGRHAGGQPYAVGVTDDQGLFVYVPWLSHVLGVSDPVSMLRYLYIALFAVTAAIYPATFWRLTGSVAAGLAAPVVLLVCVASIGFNDLYWIPVWGTLTLLPLTFLLVERWPPRTGVPAVAGIGLLAGWLTSMRSEAGLPIALALAAVVLVQRWRWWRALAVVAVVAIAYLSINSLLIPAVRHHRDDRLGTSALSRDQPTGHPFWHTAYIGLGYLPNSSGLRYRDQDAVARVQRDAPGARYLSSRYATTLRRAYLGVLRHRTGEFLRQNAAKVLVTIADAAPYLLLVALTLPPLLLSDRTGRRKRWLLLSLPAVVIGLLPALVAIPFQIYEQGLYGAIGLVAIVGLTWMIERVADVAATGGTWRDAGDSVWRRARGGDDANRAVLRRPAVWSMLAVAVIAGLAIPAHLVRRDAERWQGQSSGVLIDQVQPSVGGTG
jgi:hypothetical protein